jgi:hypothetical protein
MPSAEESWQRALQPRKVMPGVLGQRRAEPDRPETVDELDPAELAGIEEYARSADAPAHLRLLQLRIDAGWYSWQDVVAGRVDDPAARRLLDDLDRTAVPYRQLGRWAEEGRSWDEIKDEVRQLFRKRD